MAREMRAARRCVVRFFCAHITLKTDSTQAPGRGRFFMRCGHGARAARPPQPMAVVDICNDDRTNDASRGRRPSCSPPYARHRQGEGRTGRQNTAPWTARFSSAAVPQFPPSAIPALFCSLAVLDPTVSLLCVCLKNGQR